MERVLPQSIQPGDGDAPEWEELVSATLPSGTVTILLADVEGSVRHWERDRDAAAQAIARFDEIAADVAARRNGAKPVEQGEGDAFILAFSSAADAVAAALDLQLSFAKEEWPAGHALDVRMALNSGELRVRADGRYAGAPFNRAARLRALAHGRQTLLTRATHDLVVDSLPKGATLKDLGEHRLRDLSRPERVYQLCHPDLVDDFAPLRSLSAVPNNLPVMLTTFVGRDAELREVTSLLNKNRLLTLTGAGGCGKTRLAIQTAGEIAGNFDDGAWWVELAPISDPTLLPSAIAAVLSMQDPGGADPAVGLAEKLGDKRMLIVLDNCEHLIDASATVTVVLLQRCPGLSILTTSREPLGVEGEAAFRVPSLAVPASDPASADDLSPYSAARLFVERAARVRPNYRPSDEHAGSIAQICRRLDGIPLAIELAAARVRMMSPPQIVDALSDRFHLLTGGARTALPRQRTLEASVDWSYHLLTEDERILLARLSVFAGSFDLDAAEAVCGFEPLEPYAVLDLLGALVDRSLVQTDEAAGETRYQLLETIRAYARQKLADLREATAVRTRHLDHYVSLAERAEPQMMGPTIVPWLDRFDLELSNVRAAMDWALTSEQAEKHLRIAGSICLYWLVRARYGEMQRVLDEGLAAAPGADRLVRVKALHAAVLVWFAADFRRCRTYALEAAELAPATGDPLWISRAVMWRGWTEFFLGLGTGLVDLREAERLARETGNPAFLSRAAMFLGLVTMACGDMERGLSHINEAVEMAEAAADPLMLCQSITFLGLAQFYSGDVRAAEATLERATALGRFLRHGMFTSQPLAFWAQALIAQGHFERARELIDEAVTVAADTRALFAGALAQWNNAALLLASGDLDQADDQSERAAAAAEASGNSPTVAEASLTAAKVARLRGDLARSHRVIGKALEASIHMPMYRASALAAKAWLARDGREANAEELAHEALRVLHAGGGGLRIPEVLELIAVLALDADSPLEATRLIAAADALRAASGIAIMPVDRPEHEAAIERCRAALGEEAFDAARADGAAMTVEEAVAYADRGRGERKRPAAGWESLTPAELDVVRLVVQGLSNPQIAERLFISRHTVKVHLSHVFGKLGLASRAELAAEATRRGL